MLDHTENDEAITFTYSGENILVLFKNALSVLQLWAHTFLSYTEEKNPAQNLQYSMFSWIYENASEWVTSIEKGLIQIRIYKKCAFFGTTDFGVRVPAVAGNYYFNSNCIDKHKSLEN